MSPGGRDWSWPFWWPWQLGLLGISELYLTQLLILNYLAV